MAPPRVGEMIYGCYHGGVACGQVKSVGEHVTRDGMNHWLVVEDWNERTVRVRREPNNDLYEVELRLDLSGM